ncbi:hypothetical protein [Saccharothrix violaceirubra]|uniref:Uncharacterized protein n=1 Tax=Saccharothrix violaceirubra TaxID=413306 RepID=A0A7W7WZB5_9PSEU|nr:hypothetical protein [Saccharothrix violaceirubra]MBB4969320.1 hypothetical protein [Saccharothrix violaceirubra]
MVAAIAVVALAGVGGGAAVGGGAGGGGPVDSLSARKADSKKSAREGNGDAAWSRLGRRVTRKVDRRDLECLTASFGQVREFFVRTPCRSLDRTVFALDDGAGNVAVVSVVWVGFANRGQVRDFQRVMDVHGSGDIRPLGSALLGLADIAFTGDHYSADPKADNITIAETESVSGVVDVGTLELIAEVAAQLPKP